MTQKITITSCKELLSDFNACVESLEWVDAQSRKTARVEDIWSACQRGDWLLWLAVNVGVNPQTVATILCEIINPLIPGSSDMNPAVTKAFGMLTKFSKGECFIPELEDPCHDLLYYIDQIWLPSDDISDVVADSLEAILEYGKGVPMKDTWAPINVTNVLQSASEMLSSKSECCDMGVALRRNKTCYLRVFADIVRKHVTLDMILESINQKE